MAERPDQQISALQRELGELHMEMKSTKEYAASKALDTLMATMQLAEAQQKAARYDWLASGGIYRIGFDSSGGVSLEQWDSVIDEQMARENGDE